MLALRVHPFLIPKCILHVHPAFSFFPGRAFAEELKEFRCHEYPQLQPSHTKYIPASQRAGR